MSSKQHSNRSGTSGIVEVRADRFEKKISTAITLESTSDNPYVAESKSIYGYDLLELIENCSFIDTLYLLFTGELPDNKRKCLLEKLTVAFSNPGPRNNATRAVMSAAASKTRVWHLISIGASIMSGDNLGAKEVQDSMLFLKKNHRKDPNTVAKHLLESVDEGDRSVRNARLVAGFGKKYSSVDSLVYKIAKKLIEQFPEEKYLIWADCFVKEIIKEGYGWLDTGLAGAVFLDIGFGLREAPVIYQYISLPGILAHGIEKSKESIMSMPFISQDNYVIEK